MKTITENQIKRFYFPLWNRAADAHDWRMASGRLVGSRQARHGLAESDLLYQRVWDAAESLARAAHRAVTPDDLRHACHAVALTLTPARVPTPPGSARVPRAASGVPPDAIPISSKSLTNPQLDRVAALFKILIAPDDLDALIAWGDPTIAARKRLCFAIRKTPFAYIDKICRDKFGAAYSSPFWEDLPIHQLRHLALTLRNRAAAQPRLPSQGGEPGPVSPLSTANLF
jgi:hypothetical protein